MSEEGGFLHCPDIYMHKIAFGKNYQDLDIDPNEPHDLMLRKFAKFASMNIENVVVCTLDRPRHDELISSIRSTGARIKLIPDGDVSAVIATSIEDSGIDMYIGMYAMHLATKQNCFKQTSTTVTQKNNSFVSPLYTIYTIYGPMGPWALIPT